MSAGKTPEPIRFYLEAEIARATSRRLHDPEWWQQQGIPMPERYQDFAVPESVRGGKVPFAELVQDRASELITNDCDYPDRCREIFQELYVRATQEIVEDGR